MTASDFSDISKFIDESITSVVPWLINEDRPNVFKQVSVLALFEIKFWLGYIC